MGTITEVKPHQSGSGGASDVVSYDVSVKIGNTVYLTLFTPPLGTNTVKYVAGRDVLVLVGKKTITYSDMLGKPIDVPIISQISAVKDKQSK